MNEPNRRIRPPLSASERHSHGVNAVAAAPSAGKALRTLGRIFRTVRWGTGAALLAALCITAALGARRYVTSSDRFSIAKIDVLGTRRLTSDAVAHQSGLTAEKNVFVADLEGARRRLLQNPWILEASIHRTLPGTVTIAVTEREAKAFVMLDQLYLSTASGELFKVYEPGDPTDLPLIVGLSGSSVFHDRTAIQGAVRQALDVASLYGAMPIAKRWPLSEVHFLVDGSLSLMVGKEGILLRIGDPPYRKKLVQASRIAEEVDHRGGKLDVVHLDNDSRPDRVVVRMR